MSGQPSKQRPWKENIKSPGTGQSTLPGRIGNHPSFLYEGQRSQTGSASPFLPRESKAHPSSQRRESGTIQKSRSYGRARITYQGIIFPIISHAKTGLIQDSQSKKRPEPVIVSFIIKEHAFLPKNPSFPFILFIVSGQAAARFLTGSTSRFGHENLKNKETEIALILAKKNKVK